MIQCQLKLRLSVAQERELERWLFHLTGVWNWALRKIELDARDGIYHSKYDLEAMLKGHGAKLGIMQQVLKTTVFSAHQSWARCFRKLSRKPRLKGNRNRLNSIGYSQLYSEPKHGCIFVGGIGQVRFHKQEIPTG